MSDAIFTTLVTGAITMFGIVATAKSTKDKMTRELEKQNIVQNQEIQHIKEYIADLRIDVKEHNHYAKLFSETMPVVKEQIKVANQRIKDLEDNEKRR